MPVSIDILPDRAPIQLTLDTELMKKYHSHNSIVEYVNLVNTICKKESAEALISSEFDDPLKWSDTSVFIYASEIYKVNNSYSSVSVENHYSLPYGSSIRSLNGGRIDAAGFCDNLGNYVVIDHGMGVRTWYSHLSELTVKEGDLVNKGDIIGRAGSSGYAFTCGTSIFCTIGSTPVSLNEIINYGIKFSN